MHLWLKVMKENQFIKSRRVISFLDLLVILSVIAMLVMLGIPKYQKYQQQVREQAVRTNHQTIVSFLIATLENCRQGATTVRLGQTERECHALSAEDIVVYFNEFVGLVDAYDAQEVAMVVAQNENQQPTLGKTSIYIPPMRPAAVVTIRSLVNEQREELVENIIVE